MSEIIVIGGGAAGMMAAITAARQGAGVTLLEPNERLGKKLNITGKGRCNVTNDCDQETLMANIPGNSRFLYSALTRFTPQDTMAFFEALGVPLKVERGNRVFPVSDRSFDISGALERELRRLHVRLLRERAAAITVENSVVTGVDTDRQHRPADDRMTVPVVKQRGVCAATESRLAETIALTESPPSVNPMATDPGKRNRNAKSTTAETVVLFGAGNRGRTCTVAHRNLNPACLPIPPYPHNGSYFSILCQKNQV